MSRKDEKLSPPQIILWNVDFKPLYSSGIDFYFLPKNLNALTFSLSVLGQGCLNLDRKKKKPQKQPCTTTTKIININKTNSISSNTLVITNLCCNDDPNRRKKTQ